MSVNPNDAWINNSTPLFSLVGTPASGATTSASNVLFHDLNGLPAINIAAMTANTACNVLTVPAATYFPSATTTYRLTTSWRFDGSNFNPYPTTGSVGVAGNLGRGASTSEVSALNDGSMRGNYSTVFLGGANYVFQFFNSTPATITSGVLTITSLSVNGVTTSNVSMGTLS